MRQHSCEIMPGSSVTLHLSIAMIDGTEVISTFGGEPSKLIMGDGSLSEGLELALYGLKAGEKQTLKLNSDQAFGSRDETRIHTMHKSAFNSGLTLGPGVVIAFEGSAGEELAGTVLEIGEQNVTVDFNHPLAGRELVFKVEILQVTNNI